MRLSLYSGKWRSGVSLRCISMFFVCLDQGQFTCPKGHLSETYRHIVRFWARVKVRFGVKFRNLNLHGSVSDKWPFGQVTCNHIRRFDRCTYSFLAMYPPFLLGFEEEKFTLNSVNSSTSEWVYNLNYGIFLRITKNESCFRLTWSHSVTDSGQSEPRSVFGVTTDRLTVGRMAAEKPVLI